MYNLMLWAGQKVLYWLWLFTWPLVIWRWSGRSRWLPKESRNYLQRDCLWGALIVGTLCGMSIWFGDVSIFLGLVFLYFGYGKITLSHAEELARQQNQGPKPQKPKWIKKQ